MIKSQVKEVIDRCFDEGIARGNWSDKARDAYSIEVPRHENQGDFSTNFAMVAAGRDKKIPRQIAENLAELLAAHSDLIENVEVAGPGFVNISLQKSIWSTVLAPILAQKEQFGRSKSGAGTKVMVEFVSANPTGPLSIGHGRNGILGDSIARVLDSVGYEVHREYYFNDAGRQMRVLGASLMARYRELLGLENEFPEDGYQGDYMYDIARTVMDEKGDSLQNSDVEVFKELAKEAIFKDIDNTLQRLQIHFNQYYNERSLYDEGQVEDVVARLREKDLVYEKDGATWFKTTEFGQEQDRVIIKNTGEPTYRLPDIAYHREKFRRGFDWMIDIFGADHIATVPDVMAGIAALGYDPAKVQVILHQFVTLLRDGKQVKMSTRKATFITVDELLDEVGPDALRFFFLMRKPDSQLEFDLELAKKESQENPVYYVQYAHARLCSIERQAADQGVDIQNLESVDTGLLQEPEEFALMKIMADYPALVEGAARDLAPHRIIFYLIELAGQFHSYYNKHKVLGDNLQLANARLWLCRAICQVLCNGLELVGLSAPERM